MASTAKKAVVVFSGGMDSVCAALLLKSRCEQLYGITFSYGQKADMELETAKYLADKIELREHKIVDISFMKELYGESNVLTGGHKRTAPPSRFEYSIVVPNRNAVFLSIASAWAFSIGAPLVAYGAHTGDKNYPDCRPAFIEKIESAFNHGEIDGINSKRRKSIEIWAPYLDGLAKSDILKKGVEIFGDHIFDTWSCYAKGARHCGVCESCNNRRMAFQEAGITDKTIYTT